MTTPAPLLGEPLAVELMNTVWADRGDVHDELATTRRAETWLAAVRDRFAPQPADVTAWLAEPTLDPDDLGRLRELRDALRHLAAEATDDPRPAAAPPADPRPTADAEPDPPATARPGRADSALDRARALRILGHSCAAARPWSSLVWAEGEHPRRERHGDAPPAPTVVAALAEQGVELFAGDQELRACPGPGCVLYFVKRHPRREWCSAGCGNRARVARHYRRHRAQA
ncbi:CGNR zinc finger domain-containing protein [Pseudonocardia xishanensis]|uniref:CGNR zinc finger domain-containing protein n=1 Tax=Pseudonocardia xishanensis TaxID=630995 RepID=A0ABP8RU44_9PSEU